MRRPILALADYSTVGLELALSVLFGLLGGQWLDGKFGTSYLVLVGFALGVFAGFRAVWRAAQRMKRDAEAEERAAKDDGQE